MATRPLAGIGIAVFFGPGVCGAPSVVAGDHCAPDVTLHGEFNEDHFATVARIGDVNGDGVSEFAVGAMASDAAGTDSGKVSVYDGATDAVLYVLNGEAPYDLFGLVIAGVGDINGDGHPDLAVQSSYHVDTDPLYSIGRVYIFSGPDGALLRTFDGTPLGGFYGMAIAGTGDLDGDGLDDVLIGYPQAGWGPGRAQVFSGASGDLIFEFSGEIQNDWFGAVAAAVGDLTGDGCRELLISAHNHDTNGPDHGYKQGRVYLLSGCDGSLLHTFDGTGLNDSLGTALAALGDIDRDGYPDFAIGQSLRANVHSGRDYSILMTLAREPDLLPMLPCSSVRSAGDFDGDGVEDTVVGASSDGTAAPYAGRAFVFSGHDGRVIAVCTATGASDHLGWRVDGLGDVNGDGFDDIIVGAADTLDPGYAMIFHGRPVLSADITGDGAVNVQDFLMMLGQWNEESGSSADLDQDGVVDQCDLDLLLVNWD